MLINRGVPSKDIWSQSERINYFQKGAKAAIKIEVKAGNAMQRRWAVHKIMSVNHNKQECVLIDDETIEKTQRDVSFAHIIPLPTLQVASLAKRTVFQPGCRVLAVWPSTSCFYIATIIKAPKGIHTKYSMKFDDEEGIKDIEAELVMPCVS